MDPVRQDLSGCLAEVAERIQPEAGLRPLAGALTSETDVYSRWRIQRSLSAIALRIKPNESVLLESTAQLLSRLLTHARNANDSVDLVKALSTISTRTRPEMTVRLLHPIALHFAELAAHTNDARGRALLAECLSEAVAPLDPDSAKLICRPIADEFLFRFSETSGAALERGHTDDLWIPQAVAWLCGALEPKRARAVARALAEWLCAQPNLCGSVGKDGCPLLDALSILLAETRRPAMVNLSGHPSQTARWGPSEPMYDGFVSSDPFPCRLTTQELIELLKMPTCFGKARRVVLDHLGNRYGQRFVYHWAFVRYAQEQGLDLDFATPPKRPDPRESDKRMLEILDEPK